MAKYDVVVAGAGPAGSVTAQTVASAGYRVALLEEHSELGKPVHCSGFVSPHILELPQFPRQVVLNEVVGATVFGPGKSSLTLGGDRTYGLVLDRCALDRLLAQSAQEAGAELLLQHRFQEATAVAGAVAASCRTPAGERHLESRLLVEASGAQSALAERARGRGEIIWCVGAEATLPSHPRDLVRVYVGRRQAPGWFGWTIPVSDGRVRMGIGSLFHPQRAASPRALLQGLLENYPEHFAGAQIGHFNGGFIPLYTPHVPESQSPGWTLRVGDAARQVKPTTGGGIFTSMVAGGLAGQAVNEALRLEQPQLAAQRYESLWRESIGEELQRGQDLRTVFTRLSDRQLRTLIWLFARPALQRIINRYGDVDYQSPLFAHLLRAAPLLRLFLAHPVDATERWQRAMRHPITERA